MQKHPHNHAHRRSRQKRHRQLPSHNLHLAWAQLPSLRFAVLREKFANVLEPIAMR
jgi:hypothetical protein